MKPSLNAKSEKLLPERCCVCITLHLASDCLQSRLPLIWGQAVKSRDGLLNLLVQLQRGGMQAAAGPGWACSHSSRRLRHVGSPHTKLPPAGLQRAAPARFGSHDLTQKKQVVLKAKPGPKA